MKMQNTGINAHSIQEELKAQCAELGNMLGLDGPVSEKVLLATLANDDYARNLMLSRKSEWVLNHLLDNAPELPTKQKVQTKTHSNFDLIKNGAKALSKWAMTGFSTVEEEVLAQRESACLSCPNMKNPTNALQRLVPTSLNSEVVGKRAGNSTCNLCGCVISKKIRLTSESCPGEDPENTGFTRWGDPILQEVSA